MKQSKKTGRDAIVAANFKRVKAMVVNLNIYSPADDITIEHAALCLALIDEAKQDIEHIQIFPTGAMQVHPKINNLRGLMNDWQAYAKILGLTPAARKSLEVETRKTEEPKSPLLALMQKQA